MHPVLLCMNHTISSIHCTCRWFVGVLPRQESEDMLLLGGDYSTGTFMVRESDAQPGNYALTVLVEEKKVKHYRICLNDKDEKVFIASSNTFNTLEKLIEYYKCCSNALSAPKLVVPFRFCRGKGVPKGTKESAVRMNLAEWEIKPSTITLSKHLDTGHFGEVWQGTWKGTVPVAVKMLLPGSSKVNYFMQEANAMAKLNHPAILSMYGVCISGFGKEQLPLIVTEFLPGGNLLEYLRKDGGERLKVPNLQEIAVQVANGMAYLEERNYVHCDLAARNVLVGENETIKIADFGLMLLNDASDPPNRDDAPFALKWMAPEVLTEATFTTKTDVWSFGIFLFELITHGKTPYSGMTNKEASSRVVQGYRMDQPTGCPNALYRIMQNCWKTQPHERPTFKEMKSQLL